MNLVLVGKPAPEFSAKAVVKGSIVEGFSLKDFLGKYVVFFFYPLDFTFVCPTELHAFQDRWREFEGRDAQVVGCSVDSCHAHLAWMQMPKNRGGIQGVEYPLVSDLTQEIARSFHVFKEDEGVAYRGLFLIDREGQIRHQLINDLPLGRSVDEVLRTLDALTLHERQGDVCPANWRAGERSIKPTHEGIVSYFTVK